MLSNPDLLKSLLFDIPCRKWGCNDGGFSVPGVYRGVVSLSSYADDRGGYVTLLFLAGCQYFFFFFSGDEPTGGCYHFGLFHCGVIFLHPRGHCVCGQAQDGLALSAESVDTGVIRGGFILLCGGTHAVQVFSPWFSTGAVLTATKAVTAIISITTAVVVYNLIPVGFRLPRFVCVFYLMVFV